MDVTVELGSNPTIREEGFFESKVVNLSDRIKSLEYENALLVKNNEELRERVTKLSTRFSNQKGNQPRRNDRFSNKRD
jgi:predicted nuclease with TOPRIM domain